MLVYKTMRSPIGLLRLVASDVGLVALSLQTAGPQLVLAATRNARHPILLAAEAQLKEYFSGKRRTFDLKLDVTGSDFQKRVWKAMASIPFAETRSYGEVAMSIGRPGAARAVGTANAMNAISIITPSHRVVASSGSARGPQSGIEARAALLAFERKLAAKRRPASRTSNPQSSRISS